MIHVTDLQTAPLGGSGQYRISNANYEGREGVAPPPFLTATAPKAFH